MSAGTRVLAVVVALAIGTPSFAAAQQPVAVSEAVMRAYVERIPAGSKVKVTLADGSRLRGTLMIVEADRLIVRERKRRPEPPLRIALAEVADVQIEQPGGSLARGIAIGAAVGAGAALSVIAFLAAVLSD